MPSGAETANTILGIMQLANLVTRRLAPVISKYKITPQQWSVLSMVADAEDSPTMAEISRQLRVSKQNITGMVARLEALGLIRRAPDPADLRAVRIHLTRRGQQVAGSVSPLYRRWIEKALSDLSAAERKTLARAVERLTTTLAEEG